MPFSTTRTTRPIHTATRRHRPDMLLVIFVGILALLGLIVIYAISPPLIARAASSGQELGANYFMFRQLTYLGIGIAAFLAGYLTPLDKWRRWAGTLLVAGLILGMLPFLLQATPLGLCSNDACRWLDLGVVTFQPVEALKFGLVIFLSVFLGAKAGQGKLNDLSQTIWPVVGLLVAIAVVVIGFERDLGTGITIFAIAMCMLYVAGVSQRFLLMILTGSIVLAGLFTVFAPHRIERILTFINHSSVQTDDLGYQINQALIAIGSGGLAGKGLGQSIQAFGYVPEAANDSIFAILAEIFGFIGTVAVLAIFAGLFWRLLRIMNGVASDYQRLIVAGVFGWIAAHTVVNIGAMLGIFPLTGITLPFVSFGGSSLLFMLFALGLVLQISRYTSHQPPGKLTGGTTKDEDRRRGRWVGRTRHANPSRFS